LELSCGVRRFDVLGLLGRIDLVGADEVVLAHTDIVLVALDFQKRILEHVVRNLLALLLAADENPGSFHFLEVFLGIVAAGRVGHGEQSDCQNQHGATSHGSPPQRWSIVEVVCGFPLTEATKNPFSRATKRRARLAVDVLTSAAAPGCAASRRGY